MAGEAVDALFGMRLPMPLTVVRSLVEGADSILQRCGRMSKRARTHACLRAPGPQLWVPLPH